MKVSKTDLANIIMETVYEMIEEGDEGLINLMMESERMAGEEIGPIDEWVEKTTAVLQEALGIDPDAEPEVNLITEETKKMADLAGIISEGSSKLTTKNAKVGLKIVNKANRDWGTWVMGKDRNGWVITKQGRSASNSKTLDPGEFSFWEIV